MLLLFFKGQCFNHSIHLYNYIPWEVLVLLQVKYLSIDLNIDISVVIDMSYWFRTGTSKNFGSLRLLVFIVKGIIEIPILNFLAILEIQINWGVLILLLFNFLKSFNPMKLLLSSWIDLLRSLINTYPSFPRTQSSSIVFARFSHFLWWFIAWISIEVLLGWVFLNFIVVRVITFLQKFLRIYLSSLRVFDWDSFRVHLSICPSHNII